MTDQLVDMAVAPLPVTWHEHDRGRTGSLQGARSRVLMMILDRGDSAIVWCSRYGRREVQRVVYTDVPAADAVLCAICTALELLKNAGDEPAIG